MFTRLRKGYAAVAVMAVALTLLIISMTAPVASSSADFSIFNSGWNGTSQLAVLTYEAGKFAPAFKVQSTGTDVTIEQADLATIDLDPATDALAIIGPTKTFSSEEGKHIGDFIRAGGKLLLADDFGMGNSLLQGIGVDSRFVDDLVVDLAYEKLPEFSVLFDLREDPLTVNVTTLLLNYPASLIVNETTTVVVAYSSIASWRDMNGNRLQEWGEPRGPFPIVARESVGAGSILLISDPSILINGMTDKMDDGVFGANVINELCYGRTTVYFDESHRTFLDPVSITLEFTGEISDNAKAGLAVVALVLTLWISTDLLERAYAMLRSWGGKLVSFIMRIIPFRVSKAKPAKKPEPLGFDEMVAKATEEHPEWRTGLVRYLIRERERHGKTLEQK
jgi:hypothetical protein